MTGIEVTEYYMISVIKQHVEDLEDGYLDGDGLANLIVDKILNTKIVPSTGRRIREMSE